MAKRVGSIEVIAGSMFSGKTEELLRRVRRAEIANQTVQLFKPSIDRRYDQKRVVTHDGTGGTEAWIARDARDLFAQIDWDVVVIAIDEAQFFDDAIVDVCRYLAHKGKRVLISGLDQDYRGNPFEPMPTLMALAERVTKLYAICQRCGRRASRTQRLIDGEPAGMNDPLILVGGVESYEARCGACHRVKGKRVQKPFPA